MAFSRKNYFATSLFLLGFLWLNPLRAQDSGAVGVAAFAVNGPKDLHYLSGPAQDAVVGALVKKGVSAHSISEVLDPDKLHSAAQGHGRDALLVAGRINIVGQTYRVLLKWVDRQGQVGQEYLNVADQNQLLPRLEDFAASRLSSSAAIGVAATKVEPAPVPMKPGKPPKEAKAASAAVPPEAPPEPVIPPPTPVKPIRSTKQAKAPVEPKASSMGTTASALHDYADVSQRLHYEVRALAYGDVDGDGQPEVLLTSQTDLYVYHQNGKDLAEVAHYRGKALDHFVKVDVLPPPEGGKPWIVLTNLRGTQASSLMLRFSGSALEPVIQDIPYQLRVVRQGSTPKLLGQSYYGDSGRYPIYEMKLQGNRIETGEKLGIPEEIGLYNFDFLPDGAPEGFVLAGLTPMGKLKLFKKNGDKYKGTWSSRESYGGSANDVEVQVRNTFNEVVADYYIVPLRVQALGDGKAPELIVAKNDALLKEIIGRKPTISDGRMVKLQWDALGMEEAWSSKKVDGSILDYLVTDASGGRKLLVAVRMRDQSFWEGIGRKDSVLLVYDLQ